MEPRPFAVVDLHVDLPYRHGYKGKPFASGLGEFVANHLEAAGVVGVVFPLYVPDWASPEGPRPVDLEDSYARVFGQILETPPYALPGCGIRRAGGPEPRGVQTFLAFEGAAPVEPTSEAVDGWMLRGVRSWGLVHSKHNALATSSGESARGDLGLTVRGRKLARTILASGGTIDVSHASDRAVRDVLELSAEFAAPVVATHSNARKLAPHPRNLTDDQLRAIGRSGGVVGINFHQTFLAPRTRKAGLSQVVEQVRHVARVAGSEHVAIGSDYEGGIHPVPELADASRYQRLAEALLDAGMTRAEVRGVMGENALRVLCRPPQRARR